VRYAVRFAAIALVAAVLPCAVAEAHVPRFLEPKHGSPATALRLPNPETSFAIYGRLTPKAVDQYAAVVVPANFTLAVEVITPLTAAEGLRPDEVVIAGPDGFARTLPLPRSSSGRFDESFSRTSYRQYLKVEVPTKAAGRYTIGVRSGSGKRVRYVLVLGREETFTAAEVARLPAALARIRHWYRTA
jgi:hypothetical protein